MEIKEWDTDLTDKQDSSICFIRSIRVPFVFNQLTRN